MADGSITFSTDLDNAQLEKQLQSLKKKISSIEGQISQKQAEKMPLVKQSAELAANLDAAKSRLEYMQSGKEFFPAASVQEQAAAVKSIESDWNKAQGRVERYDAAISNANIKLDRQKEEAGAIAQELAHAGSNADLMGPALNRAERYMDKFVTRVKGLMRRVFVFTVITAAFRSIKGWLGKVIKTNSEASASLSQLKGALLTLAQPLVDVIIPALTSLFDVLTKITTALAAVVSMMFGTTLDKSKESAEALNEETQALEDTDKAAKKASKSMASFDEINKLSESDAGSDDKDSESGPSFDFQSGATDGQLRNILGLIESIGTALLAWKLSDTFLGSLKTAIGLMVALQGAILLIKNMFDAWQNGIDWSNFLGMLAGAALLAAGLALAFGKIGAAIGIIAAGIGLLVTGIHDAIENGWNLQNLLTTIAGMIMSGLGISVLVGSWIPLIIAGIASALLALAVATGHGEELIEGFKNIVSGFKDFFVGIFTGDISKSIEGLGAMFGGIEKVVDALIEGLRDSILSFLSWVDEKTGFQFTDLISYVKSIVTSAFNWILDFVSSAIVSIEDICRGLIEFISGVFSADWGAAWEGIKDIARGFVQSVAAVFVGAVNLIIKGLNVLIDALNSIKINVPDWVPAIGGKSWGGFNIPRIQEEQIPRLAKGTVIPPNREFMAVLGDQKSGTNIEAPMSTIEQGVENVMRRMGITGGSSPQQITVLMELDRRQIGRVVYELNKSESQRVGVSLVNR